MKNVVAITLALLVFFCQTVYAKSSLQSVSVNDVIKMGKYNINSLEKKEDIEWIVLAVEDGKALLFSKYVIDSTIYSTIDKKGYKYSRIREFLNGDFMDSFTEEEKNKIIQTNTNGGSNDNLNIETPKTIDSVFILNLNEIYTYFNPSSSVDRDNIFGIGTIYAKIKGLQCVDDGEGRVTSPYWLRSVGFNTVYAQVIAYNGKVLEDGYFYHRYSCGVRPAMWINLQ